MSRSHMASRAPKPRKRYGAGRAFYLTLLVIAIFAAWSLVRPEKLTGKHGADGGVPQHRGLARKDVGLVQRSEEVVMAQDRRSIRWLNGSSGRLVHSARDQCSYIRTNCIDEGSRASILPPAILLQNAQSKTCRFYYYSALAWSPVQYYWDRRQRFLLHQSQHNC